MILRAINSVHQCEYGDYRDDGYRELIRLTGEPFSFDPKTIILPNLIVAYTIFILGISVICLR